METNKILKNTSALMIFNVSKILFPFLTLPYLTRVLSTDMYGIVAYVKTVMSYMQIIVDFGFVLSGTKDIVNARDDRNKLAEVIGDTMLARIFLSIVAFWGLVIVAFWAPILRDHLLYTMLSYIVVFESVFLMDFVFRGLEIMHVIAIRFILMKTFSTVLTFFVIKNDSDILLIPVLDIAGSLLAVLLVFYEVKKLNIRARISGLKNIAKSIKESFVYFLSNVAATSFNAISTLIIGLKINATEVAYWSICMQIAGSIQACYNPISDGVYPEMIKSKDLSLIKKTLKYVMPIVVIGCIVAYVSADLGMMILGGEKYLPAVPIFRLLIPILFFDLPAVLLGWSTLGAIGKTKEVTFSTSISVIIHIGLLFGLIMTNTFTLVNIAVVRTFTEIILFSIRLAFVLKYKNLFVKK